MSVEGAERYLPSNNGVTHAFDHINARHANHIGDEAHLLRLLEEGDPRLFADYVQAATGWLSNRALSPFLRKVGKEAWGLLQQGPNAARIAFTPDLLRTTSDVTGMPPIEPPFYTPEGLMCTQSPRDGKVYFIVPVQFVLHAQRHPVEAIAHMAGASVQMTDIDRVNWGTVQGPDHAAGIMQEMSMRSLAASTQVILEAGDSYVPSSDTYEQVHGMGKQLFPHGTRDLPLELQF